MVDSIWRFYGGVKILMDYTRQFGEYETLRQVFSDLQYYIDNLILISKGRRCCLVLQVFIRVVLLLMRSIG